jgi:AMMECR1 domain-containing protein
MASKKEALLKTLDAVTNPKEKVSVIHAVYEDSPCLVAFVEVEKGWTDTEKLEYTFMKTNSINEAWYTSEDVDTVCLHESIL